MPAFAGVCRTPCADQGRHPGWPLRQWRNPANADGDACGAVFDLARGDDVAGEQRAVRIAPPRRQAFATVARVSPQRHPHASVAAGQGRGAMRAGRCGSFEKPPAGGPIGGGAAFVPSASDHLVIQPIPYRPADHSNRSRHRQGTRRKMVFPAVGRGAAALTCRGRQRGGSEPPMRDDGPTPEHPPVALEVES